MSLREWVETFADELAPRHELEAFETAMLEGWHDAITHGISCSPNGTAPAEVWTIAFSFSRKTFLGGR